MACIAACVGRSRICCAKAPKKSNLGIEVYIGDSDLIDYAQIIMFANIKLTVVEFLSGLKFDENL